MAVRARTILDDIHLAIEPGSLCALAGPSGAGKTTLLRVIAGLTDPTDGGVDLDGRSATHLPPARRRIGYVFQEPRLFPSLSVADNVSFALRRTRVPRRERRRRADELLDHVGLTGIGDEPIHQLSGGEQQRVALARALCARPAVLLLDEPFAALDPHRRQDLRDLVGRLHDAHPVTTVLVTHDLNDAAAIADTVAVLDHGRLVQHDSPTVVFEQPATPTVARLAGNPNHWAASAAGGWFGAGDPGLRVSGPGESAAVTCRPEHLHITTAHDTATPAASARHDTADDVVPILGTVISSRRRLAGAETLIATAAGPVTVHGPGTAMVPAGLVVCVEIPSSRVWRFPVPAP